MLCLFYHYIWVGGYLVIGGGAHASIFLIGDHLETMNRLRLQGFEEVLNHRDIFIGHLIWVTRTLGLHSFRLYIHNDTLQALGRPEDMLHDTASLQFKPIFARLLQTGPLLLSISIEMLDSKLLRITQELGTADFLVHHIHAFTIHAALLTFTKGIHGSSALIGIWWILC